MNLISSPASGCLHRISIALGILMSSVLMSGCSPPELDRQAKFDIEVQEHYFAAYDKGDAIAFLKSGGLYVDSGEPDDPQLDRPHILPLLERMKSKFGMDPLAVISKQDAKLAFAVVAKMPQGVTQEDVQKFLLEEQENFPGEILQEWGHEWLSLDFLSQQDVDALEELERMGR